MFLAVLCNLTQWLCIFLEESKKRQRALRYDRVAECLDQYTVLKAYLVPKHVSFYSLAYLAVGRIAKIVHGCNDGFYGVFFEIVENLRRFVEYGDFFNECC